MRLTVERREITYVSVDIPPELLSNIFRQLVAPLEFRASRHECFLDIRDSRGASTDDIRRLRLVCKAFNYAASPYLIPTVYLSSSQRDLDILTAVSNHPVFSKHVTELVYDCRMFDQALVTDKTFYIEELRRLPLYAFGEGTSLTKALARESFRSYSRHYHQQKETRDTNADMKCLVDAFPRMPQLAHVSVRGRSRTRFIPIHRSVLHRPDRRVTDVHMIPPQARVLWTRDDRTGAHNAVCHKGVLDFLTTISSADVPRQIRSLSIGHPTDQEELRLSTELFGTDVENVGRCGRLFENLKKIQLTVRVGDDQDDTWVLPPVQQQNPDDHLECQSRLKWALGFSRSLEFLHLNFRCAYRRPGNDVQLNHIFGKQSLFVAKIISMLTGAETDDLTFPYLHDLRLTSVRCVQSTILNFLTRHRGVIKRLSLHDVFFMDGSWIEFIDKLKILDLELDACELGLRHRPELDYGHPRYVPTGAVIQYLQGGEQHPLEEISVDDLGPDISESGVA
ncbi:hypothetical protein MMC13_001749 [Lambiella insularis]|nr:hypothetical protein [Lambiella insularis]